jgi:xylulokinase
MFQPKDWLRWRLTGEAAAEPTDASGTLLYDLARGGWSAAVAEALGLRTDLLPPLRQPAEIAGRLQRAAAEHLGLPAGLPVAAGAADTAASLAAAALPGADWGLLTVGTGGQWIAPVAAGPDGAAAGSGARLADPRGQTNLFCSADGGTYRLAAAQNVGIALDWVTGILRAEWKELYETAAAPWRASTPVFLPLLAGERWDDAAAAPGGAWEGLSLAHNREDLMRAAVEGVAFLLRAKLEDLRAVGCHPAKAVFAGGGSQHPAWHRLLGTVLQLPLFPASTPWLSARGATLIAGVATGLYRDWQDAARSVPPPQPGPEAGPGEPADEHYQRFCRLRNRAAGTAAPPAGVRDCP